MLKMIRREFLSHSQSADQETLNFRSSVDENSFRRHENPFGMRIYFALQAIPMGHGFASLANSAFFCRKVMGIACGEFHCFCWILFVRNSNIRGELSVERYASAILSSSRKKHIQSSQSSLTPSASEASFRQTFTVFCCQREKPIIFHSFFLVF